MRKASFLLGLFVISQTSAEAALIRLQRTPYDRQLERVQHVLDRDACENNGNPGDLNTINQAMRKVYRLPYSSYQEWQSPEETLQNKRADCKARAVLLHHQLNQAGVGSHRLVIGRLKGGNSDSHTWLVWKTMDGEFLLDPTYYRKAVPMEKVSPGKYIPEYIYCGGGKYGYIPNSVVLDGLDEIPQHLQERQDKTRVFLAEEEDVHQPVQANRKPDSNLKQQLSANDSDASSSEEMTSEALNKNTLDETHQQPAQAEDPSLAALQ